MSRASALCALPRRLAAALVLPCLIASAPVAAHGLEVSAFVEGDRIEGTVRGSDGGPVAGAHIRVMSPARRVLAELESDAAGGFVYLPAAPADLVIRAETLDGHAAEWTLTEAEFAGASPARPGLVPDPDLEFMVEQAVARQVKPLREQLTAHQERIRLQDLLGGIGYILGLAGLALWWRSRGGSGGR
jgi:nickel transport protein